MVKQTLALLSLASLAVLGSTTACSNTLDPYPSVVFVVDTDMAVPRFVDRLRVDTYQADGAWLDSHDYAILNARDWPVTFGMFSTDETKPTTIYVRLRGYTAGRTRDYHGERYFDATGVKPGPVPGAKAGELPRLVIGGKDVTPATEPEPMTAIDRLVQVVLEPGRTGAINVVLRGDCMGTMARMSLAASYAGFAPREAGTCIDTPNVRVALVPSPLQERSTAPTQQGTWHPTTACTADVAGSKCLPGGAFFLGSPASLGWDLAAVPQRVVALSPFRMDTNEVTVAEWRTATGAGLASPDQTPWPYDAPFSTTPSASFVGCTWSAKPLGREDLPLTCVSPAAARAYCKSKGGELPTEAQWEYAAAAVGRPAETSYPWGDGDYPDCAKSVHSRGFGGLPGVSACVGSGFGPQPVTTAANAGQDLNPLGVANLGGSVEEWMLDTPAHYDDPCWMQAGPVDPKCFVDGSPHVVRGSYWAGEQAVVSNRIGAPAANYYDAYTGFRCVYPVNK